MQPLEMKLPLIKSKSEKIRPANRMRPLPKLVLEMDLFDQLSESVDSLSEGGHSIGSTNSALLA